MSIDYLAHELGQLFTRLAARYGASWSAKYEGVDPRRMLMEWRDELRGFDGSAGYIAAVFDEAMHHLPVRPVNAPEFRLLCEQARNALSRQQARPEESKPVRGPTEAERAALERLREKVVSGGLFARPSTEWAFRIVERAAAGEHVSHASLAMAREVVASVEARRALHEPDAYDAHPSALEP
jgi:hypothetical protein